MIQQARNCVTHHGRR